MAIRFVLFLPVAQLQIPRTKQSLDCTYCTVSINGELLMSTRLLDSSFLPVRDQPVHTLGVNNRLHSLRSYRLFTLPRLISRIRARYKCNRQLEHLAREGKDASFVAQCRIQRRIMRLQIVVAMGSSVARIDQF